MDAFIELLSLSFDWVGRSTAQASILILLIFAIQLLLRRRLRAGWHYVLWLVVLARMVMPWAPESTLSLFNWVPWAQGPVSTHANDDSIASPLAFMPKVALDNTSATTPMAQKAFATEAEPATAFSPQAILAWAWLIGVAVLAVCVLVANVAFWIRAQEGHPRNRPQNARSVRRLSIKGGP